MFNVNESKMKREIKFRGRPCYYGGKQPQWVYGTFQYIGQYRIKQGSTDNGMLEPRADKGRIVDIYGNKTEVLCDTIGQFTGLHDRNGTPIYEGDILRYPAKGTFEEKNFVSFEVFWHGNDCAANHVGWQMNRHHFHGSVCGTSDISTFLPKYTEKMVIIGNIHDNPELMK